MIFIERYAGFVLFLLAVTVASAPVEAKKPLQPGPEIPKEALEQPAPQPPAPQSPAPQSPAPQPPPAQNPPQSLGWPHTILSGYSTDCSREPGRDEVIIYRDPGFGGKCALLKPGFYPRGENLLLGTDQISSLKVGSGVRLRAFEHPTYGGKWVAYAPGTRSAGIGDFNDKITSVRVEPGERSQSCDDLRVGEIALYHHANFLGDCVVLPGTGSYSDNDAMGISTDSVSSIRNRSKRKLWGFLHPGFSVSAWMTKPFTADPGLPNPTSSSAGCNDTFSSLQMTD